MMEAGVEPAFGICLGENGLATYGHLLPDSEDYLRGLLDAYDGVYGLSADEVGRRDSKTPARRLNADERT
jgi:hypothetical protein